MKMPNFTRKAIIDSFLKLLNERPLNQVTIKDIVEDCGINRNSFYYHFENLPALIEEIVKENIDRIIKEYPNIDSLEECLNVAITFALQNRRAAYHIYNSVNRDILERHILDLCQYAVTKYIDTLSAGMTVNEEYKALIIRYYKCECFGQIIEWINNGMKDDFLNQFYRFCEFSRGTTAELLRRGIETIGKKD